MATSAISTLSLHDALPIWISTDLECAVPNNRHLICSGRPNEVAFGVNRPPLHWRRPWRALARSEEHTSELQSQFHLVCRLLLEKKHIIVSVTSPVAIQFAD